MKKYILLILLTFYFGQTSNNCIASVSTRKHFRSVGLQVAEDLKKILESKGALEYGGSYTYIPDLEAFKNAVKICTSKNHFKTSTNLILRKKVVSAINNPAKINVKNGICLELDASDYWKQSNLSPKFRSILHKLLAFHEFRRIAEYIEANKHNEIWDKTYDDKKDTELSLAYLKEVMSFENIDFQVTGTSLLNGGSSSGGGDFKKYLSLLNLKNDHRDIKIVPLGLTTGNEKNIDSLYFVEFEFKAQYPTTMSSSISTSRSWLNVNYDDYSGNNLTKNYKKVNGTFVSSDLIQVSLMSRNEGWVNFDLKVYSNGHLVTDFQKTYDKRYVLVTRYIDLK